MFPFKRVFTASPFYAESKYHTAKETLLTELENIPSVVPGLITSN